MLRPMKSYNGDYLKKYIIDALIRIFAADAEYRFLVTVIGRY